PVRSVPSEQENSFVVLARGERDRGPGALQFKERVEDEPRDPWEELAESACGEWEPEEPPHLWGRFLSRLALGQSEPTPSLFKYVNDVFQKESMLGLDYEVVANRYQFQEARSVATRRGGHRKVDPRRKGEVIRLFLRDELGAEVALEHAGTGISQILPI